MTYAYQKLKFTVVGLAAVALAACSGNAGSAPSLQHPGTQSIGHIGGSMAQAGIDTSQVRVMRTRFSQAPSFDGPKTLKYYGGPIDRTPRVYVVYWGFNISGSDPSGEQTYMTNFLNGVGGSAWNQTDHQYFQIVNGRPQWIRNPAGQLKGTWVDPSSVPSAPSDSQIQTEARALESHFGYFKNASYVVATPHNHNSPGFGTQYCAYHGATVSPSGKIAYTNLPYMTDAGGNCGENSVNPGPGGVLDGVSIVEGHELADTQTDPRPTSGWYNGQYGENGDICAWSGLGNTVFTTGTFAMQPLWSNMTSSCTLHTP